MFRKSIAMPSVHKSVKKPNLPNFSNKAQSVAAQWSAESFMESFLGAANAEAIREGEKMSFKAFSIWMENGKTYMRHANRNGAEGAKIEVNGKNAERLYFAACIDNHMLADWAHVVYEQADGEGGRADVALLSGPLGGGGKLLAIYENKQANAAEPGQLNDHASQRASALGQAINRIERLRETSPEALGKQISLSICLFDKSKLTLSSAGEYYNNHAKTLRADEDRADLAAEALELTGMWVESWIVDVEELMAKRKDQRRAWLEKSMSSTSSPMIPLAAQAHSRVATAGRDESIAKNRVVYSTLEGMMNYPFVNPAGFSDAQNTRELIEAKARALAGSIATSVMQNYRAWKEAGGSKANGVVDEGFFTLGSNDRELHLVQSSCFEVAEADSGDYPRIWMCGDVGFANGQHSTLAFQMIREALGKAEDKSSADFAKSLLEADAFTGLGANKANRADFARELAEAGGSPADIRYFFDHVILQTSIKWARNDAHSWRLSYESNNAVMQEPEDLLIHKNRHNIKYAVAALGAECAKNGRTNPLLLSKNHQSSLVEGMRRSDSFVQLQEATHWLAADSMFRSRQWGTPDGAPLSAGKAKTSELAVKFKKEQTGRVAAAFAEQGSPLGSSKQADDLAGGLYSYHLVYKAIFSSSKKERESVYKDMKRTLMAGSDLAGAIAEGFAEAAEEASSKTLLALSDDLGAFADSLGKQLDHALAQSWIDSQEMAKIKLVVADAIHRLDSGKASAKVAISTIRAEVEQAVESISENGSTPGPLHAAAVIARAMAEFKRDACEKASLAADKKGSRTIFDKFSEVLAQEKYRFWSKEASFDMLVAASLARAHGSVLGHADYKIEPEARDGSSAPERLAARVKAAAEIALEKIALMTEIANSQDSSLVSHYFRHGYGAARLVGNDAGSTLLLEAMEAASVPVEGRACNFYEWAMNSGVPCVEGGLTTKGAAAVRWMDEDVRAAQEMAAVKKTRGRKPKP